MSNTITITFAVDNDSFRCDSLTGAIQEVLETIKGTFDNLNRAEVAGMSDLKVYDVDGNTIGTLSVDVEEDWGEAEDYISRMPRQYVVELLEDKCSIQCYDMEGVELLREALFLCLKDGDVDFDTIRAQCGD